MFKSGTKKTLKALEMELAVRSVNDIEALDE